MNLLIDGLPREVWLSGELVPIDTDYRTGILFEELVQDATMAPADKIATAIELYFPDEGIRDAGEAMERILWFYQCGDDQAGNQPQVQGGTSETPFSYEYDADYIYAAFVEAYGIDLTQNPLHWWQFRALFKALPEDTQFMKIVGYRTMKIPAKLPKEQREHYQKMKQLYRLPESKDRQQLESDLSTLLMNGGNPAALLEE
jgi:hypothetical protein